MNILFLLQKYPGHGGIETVTHLLSQKLCSCFGYNVTIFSTSYSDNPSQIEDLPNWHYYTVSGAKIDIERAFLSVLQKESIDIIIYQDSYVYEEYLLNNVDRSRVKIIVCEHNIPSALEISLKYYTLGEANISRTKLVNLLLYPYRYYRVHKSATNHHRRMIDLSDRYVLLSEKFRNLLTKKYGVSSNKVISITNPIKNANTPIPSYLEREKIVLFSGRLEAQKGIEYLMDIWRQVESKHTDWKLIIIGDGSKRSYMVNYIKKYGLKNIYLEGFQTNVEKYYKRARVLFMTSVFEGFGLVLAEAMSYGVVPFAFRSYESVTDIIDDNINGFLIQPFKTDQYFITFDKYINDYDIQMSCHSNALEKSNYFYIDNIAQQWCKLFNELYL